MADYGIFGHGSSGNSAFARGLDKFHGHTKKYDPLGHYSVEMPLKGAHWLVEKSSKGLADAGIGEGFNRRLNQEADENGNNFGLGSQRMGLGILSYLGGMYALGGGSGAGAGGGTAGGSAGAAGGGGGGALGYGLEGGAGYVMPGASGGGGGAAAAGGMPLGAGGYAEQGGGYVADGAGGGFNWLNSDGGTGSTGALGQGSAGMNWQDMLKQQQGKQQQQQSNYAGGRQNLPLYENEKTDQQKLAELLKALQDQQGAY